MHWICKARNILQATRIVLLEVLQSIHPKETQAVNAAESLMRCEIVFVQIGKTIHCINI